MNKAQLLAQLRTSRGLSQLDLAKLSGVSRQRLVQIEADSTAAVRRTTAEAICRGIEQARPFADDEREAFLRLFGLSHVTQVMARVQDMMPSAARDEHGLALAHRSPRDIEIVRRVLHLLDEYNPSVVARVLDAVTSLLPITFQGQQPPTVRVVNPPVQRDGYTEQVITEYERVPPKTKEAQQRKRG